MQVIIIGSGNIGGLMGHILLKNGHRIRQVYSRSAAHAEKLAGELNAAPVSDISGIIRGADIYIVAVSDNALPGVSSALKLEEELVVHTSGTVSREVLRSCSRRYGVLWPVKMVRASATILAPATMVVDGNTKEVTDRIREIAGIFSANILDAGDEKRAKMHMVATFVSNFTNHLFNLAADYCEKEAIPFSSFLPLIQAAVDALAGHHPAELQAGPAFRGDNKTIEKHLQLLQNDPQMAKIYQMITENIIKTTK